MASSINASTSGAGGLITTADNTGILNLQTAGTTAVTVNASQNVGIGTSSPVSLLQIGSTASSNTALTIASTNNTAAQINLLGDLSATYGTNLKYEGNGNYFAVSLNNAGTLTEHMRIDSSGNLLFNSGYGSVATAYGCRAWVNFNGTSTVAIRASGNVSSITDNGTGDYTVNFTNAMPDTNYSSSGVAAENLNDTGSYVRMICPVTLNTSSHRIIATHTNATKSDMTYIAVQIFR